MKVLGFDTETKGLNWFDPAEQVFLISWADADQSYVCSADDADGVAAFVKACEDADILVAHNFAFDANQLRASLGIDVFAFGKECIDTDLLARITMPERAWGGGGYRLKDLAVTYLRADAQQAEDTIDELATSMGIKLKSTGGYYDVWRAYPAEMEEYAKLDAEYARDLLPILQAKLTPAMQKVWELEKAVMPVLISAEARGTALDQSVVDVLRAHYEPQAADYELQVREVLGEDINLGSPDQLKDALVEHGVPLHRRTEKGALATHIFALAEFEDTFPVIKALLAWRKADKMMSTYIGPLTGRDVVHPSFWQCGAKTGRMSCSRPNMQNLPARGETGDVKLREVFVPRPGHVFVACDFDSIEIRILAHYLNSPIYTQLIEDGMDPHAWMASKIWGGEPEMYLKGTPGEKQRGQAKNVLFAIVYGAGAKRVADMLNCPYEEAKQLVAKIKYSLPRYMELAGSRRPKGRVPQKIERDGFVTTLYGRKQVVARDKSYVGLNALIQGGAADLFKAAVLATTKATAHLDAHPVLFVHDELVMECPKKNGKKVLAAMIEAMEGCYDLKPALKVTGTICTTSYAEGK